MANSYLNKTMGAGNRQTWTWSAWIKRSKIGSEQNLWGVYVHGNDNMRLFFTSGDVLEFKFYNGTSYKVETSRVFRDTNAWYHIVCVADTTNSTEADRLQLWVNGERQSGGGTQPTQNLSMSVNDSNAFEIGRYNSGGYFDGYMSHVAFVDGTALTPTSFGQTDSTSGIWKFKSPSGLSWGTNGFHLKMENSGNLGLDSSGQSNTYTVNGNLKQALDTPSNGYATLNPLYVKPQSNPSELTNGNTGVIGGSAHRADVPTIAVNSGKYYMEAKAISGNTTKWWWGLGKAEVLESKQSLANTDNFIYGDVSGTQGVYSNNLRVDGSTTISSIFGGAVSANDIAMLAVDLDNQKVWYGLNGTWNNGSASQSTTFNSSYPDSTALTAGDYYYIGVGNENTIWHTNYGNGYFGTTAITSAGSNGNGSLFEYDVPSGFYALNTKNINTYG